MRLKRQRESSRDRRSELAACFDSATSTIVDAGTVLFVSGEKGNRVCLIESGEIVLESAENLPLRLCAGGEIVGLCAAFSRLCTVTARATKRSVVRFQSADELLKILSERPDAFAAALRLISSEVTQSHDLLVESRSSSAAWH